MKVLHVISDENIGGAGVLLLNLLDAFSSTSVQSTVAVPCGSRLTERLLQRQVPVWLLQNPCDRLHPASVIELTTRIRENPVDLIHTNAALCARIAGRLCGVPVVYTRHCCFEPHGIWRVDPIRRMFGMLNRMMTDHAIATAEASAENLRFYGIPSHKITTIINGSQPVRSVDETELATVRKRLGIGKQDMVIGICARLELYKGHETFLQAAKLVQSRMKNCSFRFLIVGSGSMEQHIRKRIEDLDLTTCVCMTGFVEDMAPVYRLMRINVNCSTGTETSCLALSEGMSAGVPMIVSDYGGNRAMVGDGGAGLLFPSGNSVALADAICRIASDRKLEEQMRHAALERYRQCYTARRMADEVTKVYENVLESHKSRLKNALL